MFVDEAFDPLLHNWRLPGRSADIHRIFAPVDVAARILDMPIHGLNALSRMRRADGAAYVEERSVANAKGIGVRIFALDDLHAFLKEHVSLKEYADAQGVAPKWMKVRLDAQSIDPISPKYELGRVWYRREDLTF